MSSQGTIKRERSAKADATQEPMQDKALESAQPDWDRMGEIADRLLSTPPDRQAVGKALAPKRVKAPTSGTRRVKAD